MLDSKMRFKGTGSLVNGVHPRDLCGWVPDEERSADFRAANGTLTQVAPHLLSSPRKEVHLWNALMQVRPRWQRGAQAIGSCVGWGMEMAVTHLMALQHAKGEGLFVAEASTEAIYGGCRVEALGKRTGGWRDGAFGASAAKWVRDWGAILRVPYSQDTNNPEHNLVTYDGKKEKDWGNYGCGGKNDNGVLDGVARLMPVQHVVAVDTVEEAAAAIENLYTITIASMAGFGDMRRDSQGIVRRRGQWAHQMEMAGVRWRGGEPQFRIFQSWGPRSCSGPDPGISHPAISGCSWWAVAEDVAWILRSGDCWINGDVYGLPKQRLSLVEPASKWAQVDRDPSYTMAI